MINNEFINMDQKLENLLRPISATMANIHLNELNQPMIIGNRNQDLSIKEYKRNCWHHYFQNGGYHSDWVKRRGKENKLRCDGCGAWIYDKFGDEGKQRLYDAGEVYEQMACFGPSVKFNAEMMDNVILVKKLNARMILFYEFMCKQAQNAQMTYESERNMGKQYMSSEEFGSFTKALY
jgi:hypothetical protein